jgi:hypothetical protein
MTRNVLETLPALSSKGLNGKGIALLEGDATSRHIHANDTAKRLKFTPLFLTREMFRLNTTI